MKAIIDKAVGALSSYGRTRGGEELPVEERELRRVDRMRYTRAGGEPMLEELHSEATKSTIEDDVLFSKNNVFLKQPFVSSDLLCSAGESSARKSDHGSFGELESKPLDNHLLSPGFLFVTTRGSNFGTTLILHWVPNSSLKVPVECDSQCSSADGIVGAASRSSSVSIDLCSMEMIRIFYRMDEQGFIVSGELVVKSKSEEFKVFYFKNGGLNDLIHLFRAWKCFNHTCHKDSHCHTFTVFSPKLSLSELHPLEGKINCSLTSEVLASLKNADGRIVDEDHIHKVIYFQGVASSVRKEVWPGLLGIYSFKMSLQEKGEMKQVFCEKYYRINSERLTYSDSLTDDLRDSWEAKKSQIYKDVLRTDRTNEYYKGDANQHLDILLSLILNFLFYKQEVSYTQGMTDLLAPLLLVLDHEVEAFWCFIEVMKKSTIYTIGNKQVSVRHQLELLQVLTRMLIPSFYEYLNKVENGMSFMFCHRWLIVLFKREFILSDVLHVWEACWACVETKFFHLFISIAIMAIYGQKAVEKGMNIDELMVYFNSLSHQMPKEVILSQARGYLHKFMSSSQVNCCLSEIMDEEFWHRRNSPRLYCSICKGFGSCSRTNFIGNDEIIC